MAAPDTSTAEPWATTADLCSPCDDYDFDEALLEDKLQVASDILFELSGRRYPGERSETVRPCGSRDYAVTLSPQAAHGYQTPLNGSGGAYGSGWGWRSITSGWCGCNSPRRCGCQRISEIRLGGSPIVAVSEVKVDGAVLDSARYRVDDYEWLVRLPDADGTRPGWPCCQDMLLADTEEDTWSVTYTYGLKPPPGGVAAAAALACQLVLACSPETIGSCRLSDRVISVTRQGTTKQLRDAAQMFPQGLTGLNEVDVWLTSLRYGQQARPATVVVPETTSRRIRRTNT